MPAKIRVYEYSNCDSCRKALKFLDAHGVSYERVAIVETPPSVAELKKMAGYLEKEGGFRKLFNTSGQRYRELKLSEKMDQLTLSKAVGLLAKEGKLIKRPFLLTSTDGTVGFDPARWRKLLSGV